MANSRLCSIPDCGKRHFGRGYCNAHYSRWRKYGHPLKGEPTSGWAREYFEKTVIPYSGDDCLIWPFAKNSAGYGKLGVDGKFPHVHRLACEIVHGEPPTAIHEAAHLCGNGHLGCCNPRHVRWATPSENQADRISHGTAARGKRNSSTKLSASQVLRIRALRGRMTISEMAHHFGVSRGCITGILSRKNWGWLDGDAVLDAA